MNTFFMTLALLAVIGSGLYALTYANPTIKGFLKALKESGKFLLLMIIGLLVLGLLITMFNTSLGLVILGIFLIWTVLV